MQNRNAKCKTQSAKCRVLRTALYKSKRFKTFTVLNPSDFLDIFKFCEAAGGWRLATGSFKIKALSIRDN